MGYWLTRKEEQLLREIYKCGSGGMIWKKSDEMETLSGLDLVDPVCPRFGESGKTRVFLTEAGKRYIRKDAILARQRRVDLAWRWVTLAISLAALAVSVIEAFG